MLGRKPRLPGGASAAGPRRDPPGGWGTAPGRTGSQQRKPTRIRIRDRSGIGGNRSLDGPCIRTGAPVPFVLLDARGLHPPEAQTVSLRSRLGRLPPGEGPFRSGSRGGERVCFARPRTAAVQCGCQFQAVPAQPWKEHARLPEEALRRFPGGTASLPDLDIRNLPARRQARLQRFAPFGMTLVRASTDSSAKTPPVPADEAKEASRKGRPSAGTALPRVPLFARTSAGRSARRLPPRMANRQIGESQRRERHAIQQAADLPIPSRTWKLPASPAPRISKVRIGFAREQATAAGMTEHRRRLAWKARSKRRINLRDAASGSPTAG